MLVVAKAPQPGKAKTRLARDLGDETAAELAAASLLDTMDVVEAVAAPSDRMLSLAGDLCDAARRAEIESRLLGWRLTRQSGDTFASRLCRAHEQAATVWPGRTIVQIGMDTPGLTRLDLQVLARAARRPDHVGLGPARDGGWWGLASPSIAYVAGLVDVPMSTAQTCLRTRAALEARGARVTEVHELVDVDNLEDAALVSREAPHTRFAEAFAGVGSGRR